MEYKLATKIFKPLPVHISAINGSSWESEQSHKHLNAYGPRGGFYEDLEKGISTNMSRSSHSLSASIATTQSASSSPETFKTPEVPQQLPLNRYRIVRFLRYHYTAYQKIFTLIFTVNFAILIGVTAVSRGSILPASAANAAAINLAVGVIFRQEQVVNALFELLTSVPLSWPLWIRGNVAKVFHYGGLHSGCGVASVAWFLLYTALITKEYVEASDDDNVEALTTAWILVALFALIIGGAYPTFRVRFHNLFEVFHRFAGWSALAVFWAHIVYSAHAIGRRTGAPVGAVIVQSVPFWCILLASVPILISWAHLRRRVVQVEKLSNHATRLRFNHANVPPCMGIRVSTNPLLEWHSFATIPGDMKTDDQQDASPSTPESSSTRDIPTASSSQEVPTTATATNKVRDSGFSIVVSNAGDWTRRTIQSPPRALWVRGTPVRGVIYAARLFSRVVIVATGSGIGPCLSLLVAHAELLPARPRVLWSAPDPPATFGPRIVAAVRHADPDARIWDTRAQGRPDLCRLAEELVKEARAEAVFVISNPRVCKLVTTGLAQKGIRAYAPIFDS